MNAELVAPLAGEPPPEAGTRRVVIVVCDSLGVGAAPDAADYGEVDARANTLGHVAAAVGGLDLPTLERWGLGLLTDIAGVPATDSPQAVVTRLEPRSAGKDSTSGHWELMGVETSVPFPTYPDGFPEEVVDAFARAIGRGVLGNVAASGTDIIRDLGVEHLRTGRPIVYTSGDSVFQIAAHRQVAGVERLYEWCRAARGLLDVPHRVGRVIARPFDGEPGAFWRTDERRDFAVAPTAPTVCDRLHAAGIPVKAAGKIADLFDRRGITWTVPAGSNAAAMAAAHAYLDERGPALALVNLGDFDTKFGHRNDAAGYGNAVEALDADLTALAGRLEPGDWLVVTADHGTDPTLVESTDHTRELVPGVIWGPSLERGQRIPDRPTLADVGATVLDLFGLPMDLPEPSSSFASFLPVSR